MEVIPAMKKSRPIAIAMKFTHEFLHFFLFYAKVFFYPFYFAKPPQVVAGHSAEPISQSGCTQVQASRPPKTIAENTTSELKGTTVAARKEAMNNPR